MDFMDAYPVQIPLIVQWGEMDSFQHVNNIVYFRYFETARIAYFQRMGIIGNPEDHIGPILGSTECKFIFPLSYPDNIMCTAQVTDIKVDRFYMEYRVFSLTHERLAAKGTGVIVSYDYNSKKKVELPMAWQNTITSIEKMTMETH